MKAKYIFLAVLTSLAVFSVGLSVLAQGFTDSLINFRGSEFNVQALFRLLNGLACWFIRAGIILIGVMMIVYGLLFLKSRGSPQGMNYAKQALAWGVVGGAVIFGVFTIILTLAYLLDVDYPITTLITCQ